MGKAEQSTLKEELLAKLVDELTLVNRKLSLLIELNENMLKMQEKFLHMSSEKTSFDRELKLAPDVMTLLSLPPALRKTAMVLLKLDKATAEDLARETKRLRPVESAYANQLVRMGYISKKREGREVYFYIESPMEIRK
ncbi:MAG: transcriptional regulator [Candidatus Bathyarchaeota archaeon]|nr:transcriptional regulator [Candidatus Bathyarchaeota archaeon]